ncbi:hypothetical protein [Streptomyces sp. Da 82-17]|uniref:hypothetical protein n=1 Tax=Streptomyces sp. Da 82-17 TaxID=3377116 RepID=UPI0038D453AA
MTQPGPRRTTFSFAAPIDDAAALRLRLDDFATRVVDGFTDSFTRVEPQLGPRPADALSFEVQLKDGTWVEGLVTNPCPEMGAIMVGKVSASEAAEFAVWLRDSYAPAPDLVEFTTEFAMDVGEDTPWQVPARCSVDELAALFQRHIDTFDR